MVDSKKRPGKDLDRIDRNILNELQKDGRISIRDAPTLQKVMPVGAKFGINIAPEHLHSDSFKEDMHRLRDALP
ncbi:AsnC family transcriptional regulator, partial [Salmonella enterica subsp. enterica serovar Anatum]|nr:AsnC family transcriptional regulator [Salmonella enterica subsp. enterica serovar Anatum]